MDMTDTGFSTGKLHYETRLVCFFDTLGWKAQIERAGNDPDKIFALASLPRMFGRNITDLAERSPGAHITSFSDNVIVSIPYQEDLAISVLEGFARLQFGAATAGFFIRGAVTVGQLYHDEFIVFGPALNRAYELESKDAVFPRVILDPLINFGQLSCDFVANDGVYTFIDPFSVQFLKYVPGTRAVNKNVASQVDKTVGILLPDISTVNLLDLLSGIYANATRERGLTDDEKVQKKYDWVLDRIIKSLEENKNDESVLTQFIR